MEYPQIMKQKEAEENEIKECDSCERFTLVESNLWKCEIIDGALECSGEEPGGIDSIICDVCGREWQHDERLSDNINFS